MLVCVVSDLKFSCCSPSLLAAASLYVATSQRTDLDMALILPLWKLLARITGTEMVGRLRYYSVYSAQASLQQVQ